MLRFAILKEIKAWGKDEAREDIILEYNDTQIRSRLQARTKEHLVNTESWLKRKWTKDEVAEALEEAFNGLVKEFKEETIKIS